MTKKSEGILLVVNAAPPAAASSSASSSVLGVCGSIAAYKAVEVCRRLVDAGAPRGAGDDGRRHPVPRRGHALGAGVGAGARLAVVRRRPDPAHRAGRGRPTWSWWRRPRPPCWPSTRPASPTTCSPPRCWPPGRRWSSARPCTPRCGSTRPPSTTSPPCAGGASWWSSPASAGWPAATRAPAAWPRSRRSWPPSTGRSTPQDLAGRTVLVTAGGTREPLDPVRFIGNRSSGKQGDALAAEAAARGATVTLVTAADRPAPAGVDVRAGRDRGRDGGRRARPGRATPTWW